MQLQFTMMTRFSALSFIPVAVLLGGCASNPNKAKEVQTEMENTSDVGAGVKVGLNEKGEMITRKKVAMNEALAELQRDVNELEIDIYGDETLGRSGLYGVLSECLDRSVEKKNGGDGKLKRLPEKAILVPPEEATQVKIGLDENNKLVSVSEEYLLTRIHRYQTYKAGYLKQKEDFKERIRICKADLKK